MKNGVRCWLRRDRVSLLTDRISCQCRGESGNIFIFLQLVVQSVDTSTNISGQNGPLQSAFVYVLAQIRQSIHERHVLNGLVFNVGKHLLRPLLSLWAHSFGQSQDTLAIVLQAIIVGNIIYPTTKFSEVDGVLCYCAIHIKDDANQIVGRGEGIVPVAAGRWFVGNDLSRCSTHGKVLVAVYVTCTRTNDGSKRTRNKRMNTANTAASDCSGDGRQGQ